jgi:hypothetical protein
LIGIARIGDSVMSLIVPAWTREGSIITLLELCNYERHLLRMVTKAKGMERQNLVSALASLMDLYGNALPPDI